MRQQPPNCAAGAVSRPVPRAGATPGRVERSTPRKHVIATPWGSLSSLGVPSGEPPFQAALRACALARFGGENPARRSGDAPGWIAGSLSSDSSRPPRYSDRQVNSIEPDPRFPHHNPRRLAIIARPSPFRVARRARPYPHPRVERRQSGNNPAAGGLPASGYASRVGTFPACAEATPARTMRNP